MSKKSKKQSNSVENFQFDEMSYVTPRSMRRDNIRYPVEVPQIVNMDDIARYLDDELYQKLTHLENDRNKVVDARLDPMLWEVEIAYLRREAGIRKTRRELHEAFLKEHAGLLSEEDVVFEDDVETEFVAS